MAALDKSNQDMDMPAQDSTDREELEDFPDGELVPMGFCENIVDHLFDPKIDDNDHEEWEEERIGGILHPECNFCSYWDLLSMVLIMYSCFTIPYRLAFNSEAAGKTAVFDRCVDALFMTDILITFRTAIKPVDQLITSPSVIARAYVKPPGWFLLDFISSFPFDLMLSIFFDVDNPDAARVLKMIRIGRMVKILRMVRLKRLLKKVQDSVGIKNGVMTSVKFGLFILFAAHFEACAWFQFSSYEPDNNWALGYCIWADMDNHNADCGNVRGFYSAEDHCCASSQWDQPPQCDFTQTSNRTTCHTSDGEYSFVPDGGWCDCMETYMKAWKGADGTEDIILQQYVASLYWSLITMTTLGYGDITPSNNYERGFCVWAMLIGACIFAYSVTNMCTLVHNLNPSAVYFRNRVDQLNDLMEYMHLPKDTRKKVMDFVFFKMNRSAVCIYNQDLILHDLSKTLQEDVQYISLHTIIEGIPFFKGESRRFISQVAVRLKGEARAPGDLICLQGRIAIQMYMLRKGGLVCTKYPPGTDLTLIRESTDGDGGTVVAELGDGSVFSVGALFRASKYGFSVRVTEYADLYHLTKYDFDVVLATFHQDKNVFLNRAIEADLVQMDENEEHFEKPVEEEEEEDPALAESEAEKKIDLVRTQIKLQSEYIHMLMDDG